MTNFDKTVRLKPKQNPSQTSCISYRFNSSQLSPVRHIASDVSGDPLCGIKSGMDNGVWEHVTGEATCSICKKRSRFG